MKKNAGFSVMELMTVIAIIGILSAIIIPNVISWQSNQKLNSSAREILSLINGARIQAIKGNSTVTINFSTGTPGAEIQSSQRNRAVADATDPEATKTVTLGMAPGLTISNTGFGGDNEVIYNSQGMLTDNTGGTVTVTDSSGSKRNVVVSSTGIARITAN